MYINVIISYSFRVSKNESQHVDERCHLYSSLVSIIQTNLPPQGLAQPYIHICIHWYALVDTHIINDKKYIICTEAITFFHSISDINHIMQNTDITSQLSTYTITPSIHNHVVAHIQIITIHTRYFHIIITVDRKRITPCNINNRTSEPFLSIPVLNLQKQCLKLTSKGLLSATIANNITMSHWRKFPYFLRAFLHAIHASLTPLLDNNHKGAP